MPEPFGILCPITRVRATQPPEDLPLRHELIATGPEQGFEDIPDEVIKAGFIQGLVDAGFSVPDDPLHKHVVLRRNRESFHRYLLTRPGELHLRPAHQSPLENLCLAGAWVRNEFALPCVDAAAEGAIKVAGFIAARALARRKNVEVPRFAGDASQCSARACRRRTAFRTPRVPFFCWMAIPRPWRKRFILI